MRWQIAAEHLINAAEPGAGWLMFAHRDASRAEWRRRRKLNPKVKRVSGDAT
ncbi:MULTISPECIES: hypothetical protein [Bradyrhizobium]